MAKVNPLGLETALVVRPGGGFQRTPDAAPLAPRRTPAAGSATGLTRTGPRAWCVGWLWLTTVNSGGAPSTRAKEPKREFVCNFTVKEPRSV